MTRRLLVLALLFAGCAGSAIRPKDVSSLKAGEHVRVHVWPPGAPGPGYYLSGTYQSQDDEHVVVVDGDKPVTIEKNSIHDDEDELQIR